MSAFRTRVAAARRPQAAADTAAVERPVAAGVNVAAFGSDVVADALRDGAGIVATQFDGKRGHPVGFSRKYGALLAALGGDEGARSIVAARPSALRLVDVDDPGVLRDVDRPSDLA